MSSQEEKESYIQNCLQKFIFFDNKVMKTEIYLLIKDILQQSDGLLGQFFNSSGQSKQ